MKGGALTRSWISISFSWVYFSNRTCGTENQSRKQTCRVKQSLRCITTCTDASEIRVLQRGINVSAFFCLWFSLHFYSPRTNAKHEVRTYTRSGSYPLPRALRSTLYSPAVVSWLNHLVVPRLPKVSLSQIGPNYHPLKWQFLSWFQYPQVYFLNTNLVNLTFTLTRGLNANQSNPFQHQSTNKLWTLLSSSWCPTKLFIYQFCWFQKRFVKNVMV